MPPPREVKSAVLSIAFCVRFAPVAPVPNSSSYMSVKCESVSCTRVSVPFIPGIFTVQNTGSMRLDAFMFSATSKALS